MIELRDYQQRAFEQARAAFHRGARRILIVAPTGGGKTVLASALMQMSVAKGKRASFVVDRLSLIQQTSDTFDRYGIDHGVIQGEHERFQPELPIQICSVQTLGRRTWPETNLDVFDEAHVLHQTHKNRMKEGTSTVIGLTATPFTKGLANWFDEVINVTTTRTLIEEGWLSPYRIFSCTEPDMTGVTVKSTGEWDDSESSARALAVVGSVVDEYTKHGEGRKFICSAVDTRHVEELRDQFLAAGIKVATYTYKDSEQDRSDITTEFKKPDSVIRGLITVTAASRGFDIPDVSCVIMARPLRKSLAEHIQLFGRGLRISPSTGKTNCLILDHSGNCTRFFNECEDFFDLGAGALDDGSKRKKEDAEKKEIPQPMKCPQCRALHKPALTCPDCGHEYPRPKPKVEIVPKGTLKELIVSDDRQALTQRLWPEVCGYVLQRKEGEAAKKQALAIYFDITGRWPLLKWEKTIPRQPSVPVLARIRSAQARWTYRHDDAMYRRTPPPGAIYRPKEIS